MADQSQGPGWWVASDGKWYPPETAPAAASVGAVAVSGDPADAGLPAGVRAASPWARLLAYLLETVLVVVTLWIGWLIWALFLVGDGQTPAKRLLDQRVIRTDTGRPAGFARMFWLRGLLAGLIAGLVVPLTLGIILLMPFWDRINQNLWDKVSGTRVVVDPHDAWGTRAS